MRDWTFPWRMAWRDSRTNRARLLLYMSSIILGVAALVAINSFSDNLVEDIDEESASLLGADLAVSGNRPITADLQQMLDSLPGEKAEQWDLNSMAYFPKTEAAQFVSIMALKGDFPFYGKIKTRPVEAARQFQAEGTALVDQGLMQSQGLSIGDSIRLGEATFEIGGVLEVPFGSSGLGSSFAPAVYIPLSATPQTGLVQVGSLVDYNYFRKLPKDYPVDEWAETREELFRNESLRPTTINQQKENLNEAFSGLSTFLNLVALVALILGCIGVASSVLIYVRTKVSSIAVLRCLGMKGRDAFMIYLFQILVLGIVSVLIGVLLGSAIQYILPRVFSDFLPFEVSTDLSWPAMGSGFAIGTIVTILFSLIPLLRIRNISPLRTLRVSADADTGKFDPWTLLLYVGIAGSMFAFLWYLSGEALTAMWFLLALLVAFLILFGVSKLIVWGIKRFFPRSWNFVFRQGLSNLFRPNNQTTTLLVSIGLGTAILTTVFVIQGLLLQNVAQMEAGNQPNMILYGIEKNQQEGLAELTQTFEMPLIQQVPIVTMRIAGWQGKTKAEWLADTTRRAESWAFNREIRTTFRDTLDLGEELLSGNVDRPYRGGDSIFISLDDGFAEDMGLAMGDRVTFNVQGMLMTTYVGSLRKIDFANMRTRFFVVFPTGVLEEAPQFHVLVTKSSGVSQTGEYRNAVVEAFPNVSVVDLGSILSALSDILSKVTYVIQFMAGFSILTGLIVLISSLFLSKFQRIKESVLLRTIGASRRQIFLINATEYTILGCLSALTGILLALAGSYLLARFELELDFSLNWWPIIGVFGFVVGLVVLIGLLNSREVVNKPPLEVLRKEV